MRNYIVKNAQSNYKVHNDVQPVACAEFVIMAGSRKNSKLFDYDLCNVFSKNETPFF